MNVTTLIGGPALFATALATLLMGCGLRPMPANQALAQIAPSSGQQALDAFSTEQEPQVPISVEAPLVNVDVLVTDQDGRILSGLKRQNFHLLDNGRLQVITHFEPLNTAPITIAMLMEYSGTAYSHFAYKAASWGSTFLNHLEPLDWVALVTYDIKPTVRLDFTRNKGAEAQQPFLYRCAWLASPFGPRGMQGWRLSKRSLVFENDHRPFAFSVFLDLGRCSAPICAVA